MCLWTRTRHEASLHLHLHLQDELDKMKQYCVENKMTINSAKTKVVLFNTARKYDFQSQLSLDGITNLEVIEEFRLLGINFQSNLSWQ